MINQLSSPNMSLITLLVIAEAVLFIFSRTGRRYQNSWADYRGEGSCFFRVLMLLVGAVLLVVVASVA
jgi:hypothetical protein